MKTACALLLALLAAAASASPDTDPRDAAARELVARFSQQLRSALEGAMQAGGPLAAVSVCHEQAPGIAGQLEAGSGWQLRRTALRVRNPANAPDDWERQQLEDFLRRQAAGEDIGQLTARHEDENGWRYLQAIPTGPLCTVCHGSTIDPALAAHIRQLYPADAATGFAAGSLRGAFSLRLRPTGSDTARPRP